MACEHVVHTEVVVDKGGVDQVLSLDPVAGVERDQERVSCMYTLIE